MASKDSDRAGEYMLQVGGYKAFIPKKLPPDPPIEVDSEMLQLLSQADIALGRLDGAGEFLVDPDIFVAMYIHKEAVFSSQIEGTQASLVDVLAFEADAAMPDNLQDIKEVVNYIAALHFGLQRLDALPLSLRLIREIHALLLAEGRGSELYPGEFRTHQNWIGHRGSTIETAKFVPPPVENMLDALSDLEKFLHYDKSLPTLLKAGIAHAQFETIHPFLDGNGRMGRLLITFLLCHEQVLRRPLLYLSHFFKMNKVDYFDHLQRVRLEGDWEGWLKFFLRGVYDVAKEATTTVQRIVQLREFDRGVIEREIPRSESAYKLLDYLYTRPIITVQSAAKATDLSFTSANRLMAKFQECGILRVMDQEQRRRRFVYDRYLSLFAEQP